MANDNLTDATRRRGLFAAEPVWLDSEDITEPVAASGLPGSDDSEGARVRHSA